MSAAVQTAPAEAPSAPRKVEGSVIVEYEIEHFLLLLQSFN